MNAPHLNRRLVGLVAAGLLTAGLAAPAGAVEILTNGGFEAGFSGWTRIDAPGSDGSFLLQTGTTSPVTAVTVPAPPGGTQAAMTDQEAGGSHLLYQDFVLPAPVGSAILSFDLFVGNRAGDFFTPGHLDFAGADLNQQARVDLMAGAAADPFSVAAGDILQTVYQTEAGDPPVMPGYSHVALDVTALVNAHAGALLRLRFAEVDNVSFFHLGVDNASLVTDGVQPVPEPASLASVGAGLLALLVLARQRSHRRRA